MPQPNLNQLIDLARTNKDRVLQFLAPKGVVDIRVFADQMTLVYWDESTWTKAGMDFVFMGGRPLDEVVPDRPKPAEEPPEEIDHDDIPGDIVCPHCGHAHPEAETEGQFYTEDGVESWCDECGEKFTCYGSVSWYFTTKKGHVETPLRLARQAAIKQKWKDNPPIKHYMEDHDD
jgi:hypothetical protein